MSWVLKVHGLRISFVLCVFGVPALLSSATCSYEQWPRDEYGFSVDGGDLLRGDRPFTLRGLYLPWLGDPGVSYDWRVDQLNRISLVGGNAVLIDLNPDFWEPKAVFQDWIHSFLKFAQVTRRRELGLILRVPEASGGDQRGSIFAQLLSKRWDILIWFDGAGGDRQTEIFKRLNSDLVTLGPPSNRFADVVVLENGTSPSSAPTIELFPDLDRIEVSRNFILKGSNAAFRKLEEAVGARVTAEDLLAGRPVDADGFATLFDGTDLSAWEITGDPAGWKVEGDTLTWVRRGGRYVRTRAVFADFILRLEFKIAESGNSGVFVRAPAAGRHSRIGMEIQIMGDAGKPPHKNGTGAIYDVRAPRVNASRPAGEWNELEIQCDGNHFRAVLNGEEIHNFDLAADPELRHRLHEGFIMLQDHGAPVSFRNIRIKDLRS